MINGILLRFMNIGKPIHGQICLKPADFRYSPVTTPDAWPRSYIKMIMSSSRVGYLFMISPLFFPTITVSEWRKPPQFGS